MPDVKASGLFCKAPSGLWAAQRFVCFCLIDAAKGDSCFHCIPKRALNGFHRDNKCVTVREVNRLLKREKMVY